MKDLIYFYPENHEAHASPDHPERPERIAAICDALRVAKSGMRADWLARHKIEEEVLAAIHTPGSCAPSGGSQRSGRDDRCGYLYDPLIMAAGARIRRGGQSRLRRRSIIAEADKGFALCRPPGHHATPDQAMGFCLLNNVALAAEHILQSTRGPEGGDPGY